MLRALADRPTARRRGAVLIVVLAMLVLFAVLGLSFVLYSESQQSAAGAGKQGENREARPNPQDAVEWTMGQLVYGTTDETSVWRGQDLAGMKYGYDYSGTTTAFLLPYAGDPSHNPTAWAVTDQPGAWNTDLSGVFERDVVNYSRVVTTPGGGTWFIADPMRQDGATIRTQTNATYTRPYVNRAAAYTYPDRRNFALAQMNPATGEVVLPSFYRPDLFGTLDPANPNWTNQVGRLRTLRPRPLEHPNFPRVPQDADGQYRGDVANLKFISGGQKNDSLWMDAGGPVLKWRGRNYKAMVAPLILDLSGRVNLSVAGNLKNTNAAALQYPHGSKDGLGPWEVNPLRVGMTAADVQALVQRRYGKTAADLFPPNDPYTATAATARINGQRHPLFTGGRMPSQYAPLDVDGNALAANDGPLTLPQSGGFTTTPLFNNPLVVAAPYRYEPTQAELTAALANHPAQFNPLLYRRGATGTPVAPAIGAGGIGNDDLIRLLTHFSDPKGRPVQATFGQPALNLASVNPAADTPAARQTRALSTPFSTTQQWASVRVQTGPAATDVATLGPIDLNRPLPDYRKNPTLPASPVNVWNPAVAAEQPHWYAAHSARQRLARDVFVRLAGRYGLINNTAAVYLPASGQVNVLVDQTDATGVYATLVQFAQMAVNLVDYIDGDEVVTPFVWRPTADSLTNQPLDPSLDLTAAGNNFTNTPATRVVYGTELPRVVLNEVYACVANTRTDTGATAASPLQRRYYIELHNPLPADAVHPDGGAARLQYQSGVTQVTDPVALTTGNYTGATFNPYRIEVAVTPSGTVSPYSTAMTTAGYGASAADTQTVLGATSVVQARINTYTHDATAPSAPATLAATPDQLNVVQPATAATGANGGNQGYYLIGPRDPFPTAGVTNTLSLPDPQDGTGTPVPGVPPANPPLNAPVNALTFDVQPLPGPGGAPTETNITEERAKTSVVVLRRLLNPCLPPQENAANANYNPYVTVDFVENVPTRDRATLSNAGPHTVSAPFDTNAPTVGRVHPFAAAPAYGTATAPTVAAVQDQINAAVTTSPPHTFFSINNQATVENVRGTAPNQFGFEWLVHPDRELVSLPEAAHVSAFPPAFLTQRFFNGTPATGYHGHAVGLTTQVPILNNAYQALPLTEAAGLIEVGSRLPGVPLGGRQAGKVNVNTANGQGVLDATFDPQAGNDFAATAPTYVADLWANRIAPAAVPVAPQVARTANGLVPRATVWEGGADHPFMWGSGVTQYTDNPLARKTTNTAWPNADPFAFAHPAPTGGHPYHQFEPLRKGWNNLTSTSDSFLVLFTVGFFEVENAGPWDANNPPRLGVELHDQVPGDLRAQFGGVIDRSQLATEIVQTDATGLALGTSVAVTADANNPVPRGVQSKLVSDVLPGATTIDVEAIPPTGVRPDGVTVAANTCAVLGDGVVYTIGVGSRVRLGYGDATAGGDGEWVTVLSLAQRTVPDASGVSQPVAGQVTLTLSNVAPAVLPARFHAAGGPIGNVIFGHPGPQGRVTLTQLKSRGLLPYFTRLDP
jgi:hypothetical protein